MQGKVLVVLPYSQNGAQGNEIRLALAGWKRFCTFDYHYVVIGDFDDSLREEFGWVEFINVNRIPKRKKQYNPLLDVLNKLDIACQRFGGEYSGFVRTMDDFFAIKPFGLEDVAHTYYISTSFEGNKNAPTNFWCHSKWKTRALLDREGLPHVNYTTHHPCYFEIENLKALFDKYNMREESYVLDDLYYNVFEHDKPILADTIRLGIWNNDIFRNKFQKAIKNPNIKFVCNSVKGWCPELEDELGKIIFKK